MKCLNVRMFGMFDWRKGALCLMSIVALCALSGSAVAEEEPNTDIIQWALESVNYETFEAKHGSFVTADGAKMIKAYDDRIAADDKDYAAYICRAFARMKTLGENEFFKTTMGKFGFEFSAATMHVTGKLPSGVSQINQMPKTTDMVGDFCAIALPVMKAALDDFDKVPKDWPDSVEISKAADYQVDEPVFFDYADVLFAKAALCEMMSFLNILHGYDVSLQNRLLDDTCNNRHWAAKDEINHSRGVQAILKNNGGLMNCDSTYPVQKGVLAEAQGWMASAAVLMNAFDIAQASRTDGRNHFFMLALGKKETELANLARRNVQSIIDLPYWTARVDLTPFADYLFTKDEKRDCLRGRSLDVTLRNFFEGRVERHVTFPDFDGDFPLLDTLPDATLSGTFPGMSRAKLGAYLELFGDIPAYEPDDTVKEYAAFYVLPDGTENNPGNPATFAAGLKEAFTLLNPSLGDYAFIGWSNDGVIPAGTAQALTFEATFDLPPEGNELNPWKIGAEGHEDDVKAWTNGEGRLVIEGRSALRVAMRNFANASDAPWADAAGEVTEVTIAASVTNVGKNAFAALDNLRSINGEDVKSTYRTVSTVNGKPIERFNMMEDALGCAPLAYPSGTPEPETPEGAIGAGVESVRIEGGKARIGVSVSTNADLTATNEGWQKADIESATREDDGTVTLTVPVPAEKGFIILKSMDAEGKEK